MASNGRRPKGTNVTGLNGELQPFLKWAGGKRWLIDKLAPLFSQSFGNYIEPFLGGGAALLALSPRRAMVGDINPELINCYRVVKNSPDSIFAGLVEYQKRHSKDFYYKIRADEPLGEFERALRFIYLNRTCFNGIYRVNKHGKFNVPKGSKDKIIFEDDNFRAISNALKNTTLVCSDFEELVDAACCGDLVFVDPPYTTKHNKNGFVRYNEKLFSWADQERLAESVERAAERGATVIVTNADHESVRSLYEELSALYFRVGRHSIIGGPSSTRSKVTEAVFVLGQCEGSLKTKIQSRLRNEPPMPSSDQLRP